MKNATNNSNNSNKKTAYDIERARLIKALLQAGDQYQLANYMLQLKQLARRYGKI